MVEFLIAALGAAGDGIARTPEGSCFIAATLPGETVRAEPSGKRADAQVATLDAVLVPSPERVTPPCRHFPACGGCVLQHWAMPPYQAWKRAKLADALARAGFPEAPVSPLVATPPGSRRRADLAIRRTPAGIVLGFHTRGGAAVQDISGCTVLDPALVGLLAPLRALLLRLPALRREGSALLNLLDSGPDLLLRTDAVLDAAGRGLLAAFAVAQHIPRIAWARADGAMETAAQQGPVALQLGGAVVAPPPGAFLQATPAGEAAIIAAVLAGLPAKLGPKAVLADLYAGLGTLSLPLAARARVVAYEGAADAVVALGSAAGRAGLRLEAVRRDLVRQPLAVADLGRFAAVVLDPPFAGAADQVALLARARVPRVIYVSCNPAALARDAQPLAAAGYRVVAAVPIDQFLWSAQLEAVVTFSL